MTPIDARVTAVPVPTDSAVLRCYARTHLADAYAVALPSGAATDPEVLARHVFGHQAPWVQRLMRMRDAIMKRFGVKTSVELKRSAQGGAPRVGIFRIYEKGPCEIVMGEDDAHLDFRVSVMCRASGDGQQLVASTVVHCHNLLGRAYILVIAPFHRQVVRSSLRRAALAGWPMKDTVSR